MKMDWLYKLKLLRRWINICAEQVSMVIIIKEESGMKWNAKLKKLRIKMRIKRNKWPNFWQVNVWKKG